MANHMATLEMHTIKQRLSDMALSERAKEKALALMPTLVEAEVRARLAETSGAKTILESMGSPPLVPMQDLHKTLALLEAGAMLLPEQLTAIAGFANTCKRMRGYLKRAESIETMVSFYGQSLYALDDLYEEIDRGIRNDAVDDHASAELKNIRRKMETTRDAVRGKLEAMLRSKKEWFSESFIVTRGGRLALPVKKAYRSQVQGTVVDISSSGGTVFIEPSQAGKLSDQLLELTVAEENEVRRILYELTAKAYGYLRELRLNADCMETLDFAFAKARLSLAMQGVEPNVTAERRIEIIKGRHPLLDPGTCVPLDFRIGGAIRGVIITGPNTGGKTVALKTVGLLSLMAQSGLHVPAARESVFTLNYNVLCDIGDGQSIAESLSTFSAHMTNIIGILRETTHESLVLLDELGAGTDPAEGMGLAVAILEELRRTGCLFVSTSHYPQIKAYAEKAEGLTNARMAFDRDSLRPLYRLQMGAAGESCALHIAKRLGFPEHMLRRAEEAAYHGTLINEWAEPGRMTDKTRVKAVPKPEAPKRSERFQPGDSVRVHRRGTNSKSSRHKGIPQESLPPSKEMGIVWKRADDRGMIGVLVKGEKRLVNHRYIQLVAPAAVLYPDGYDLSVVLDTVENRKARHRLDKGNPNGVIQYAKGEEPDTL